MDCIELHFRDNCPFPFVLRHELVVVNRHHSSEKANESLRRVSLVTYYCDELFACCRHDEDDAMKLVNIIVEIKISQSCGKNTGFVTGMFLRTAGSLCAGCCKTRLSVRIEVLFPRCFEYSEACNKGLFSQHAP